MTDLNKNHASNVDFRVPTRKSSGATSKAQDAEIGVLRNRYWFLSVKIRAGAKTAYELERMFEPDAFGKISSTQYFHRNSWSRYQRGKHKPRKALVDLVDKSLPGTARELNHVLWDVLNFSKPAIRHVDGWLSQLQPEVQSIVFKIEAAGSGLTYSRRRIDGQRIRLLEANAGLDALACTTLFLREAMDAGDQKLAFQLGESIYRILLIICTDWPMDALEREIFDLYNTRFFSRLEYEGVGFKFDG